MIESDFSDKARRVKFGFRKKFIFIPFLAIGAIALLGYIVMQLWNNILPDVLHTGTITYWQALGIFVLAKIIFGFGHGGRGRGNAPWMKYRMERFKNMSPEEQQRFREEMRARCGKWGRHRNFEWEQPAQENTVKPTE